MKHFTILLLCIYNLFAYSKGLNGSYIQLKDSSYFLITFAGWSVKQDWANNWTKSIVQAKSNFKNYSFIAFKGPDDVLFKSKYDIDVYDNVLDFIKKAKKIKKVIIIAHSSGTFVAHNFLKHLYKVDTTKLFYKKISYYNLDGDIGSVEDDTFLSDDIANYLNKLNCVFAVDTLTNSFSANYKQMINIKNTYPFCNLIKLLANANICNKGAKWCLHDYLIVKMPFNKNTFDLKKDYYENNNYLSVNVDYLTEE